MWSNLLYSVSKTIRQAGILLAVVMLMAMNSGRGQAQGPIDDLSGLADPAWLTEGSVREDRDVLSRTSVADPASGSIRLSGVASGVSNHLGKPLLDAEYEALVALYNITDGPNWWDKTNWLTDSSPCGWHGVSCTNGRVTRLNLHANHLSGNIPSSLSALTNLQYLLLGSNQLTGSIPASLSALTSLQTLSLNDNQLTGSIPASLSALTSLQFLDLSYNSFFLSGSGLMGSIPASLSALTNLRTLNLQNNHLSGSIPSSLSALTSLQYLDLSYNSLSGSIPSSLSALTSLQYLDLHHNSLSGNIPSSLSALTNLVELILYSNSLSGCIPASFSVFCGKTDVNLSYNLDLPGEGKFATFCASGLGSDAFQPLATVDPNPACVGQPVSLSVTAGTDYRWRGPDGFSASVQSPGLSLSSVSQSGLYSVSVTNGSSSCVASADVRLTVQTPSPDYQALLDFYNSTGGPNWIKKTDWGTGCSPCNWYGVRCTKGRVTRLDLHANHLSGNIPSSLSALTDLQLLDLNTNNLRGSVPVSLTALTNLLELNLSDNTLGGSIPSSLSALTNLQVLFLSNNELSGSIPSSLSALTKLRILNLQNNNLSGCLPASLSVLCGRTVNLSNNPGLPGGGDFASFCQSGLGSDVALVTASPNSNCVGQSISLSVTAGTTYHWRGPDGFSASVQSPSLSLSSVSQSGLYSVSVTNGGGCVATATVSLTVNPLPSASLLSSGILTCAQTGVTLTAGGGQAYAFRGPDGALLASNDKTVVVSQPGLYSVTVTSDSGCQSTTSITVGQDLSLPTLSVSPTSGTLTCASPSLVLTASSSTTALQWSTGATTPSLVVSQAKIYSLTATGSNGCSATATANVTSTQTSPTVSIIPSSATLTCTSSTVSLSAVGSGTYRWNTTEATTAVISVTTAGTYSVTLTGANGCSATASQIITDGKTPPPAPTLSSLTVTQGSPTVNLTAANCSGTLSWTGPNGLVGSGPIQQPTTTLGQFVYSARCSLGTCVSPASLVTITVQVPPVTASLSISHLDGDNNLTNNIIRPYLQINNEGNSPLAYSQITVRYWLTSEDFSPLVNNLSVYWAQLGTSYVKMRYVPLGQTPRQGAFGYIEYRFEAGAGSLAAKANSGPIQNGIGKNDWTNFLEGNDYSYAANPSSYTKNPRITAYVGGQLVWGTEPPLVTPLPASQSLKAYSESKNGSSTNTISTYLQVKNEGNVPLAYQSLKARYFFTSEGSQTVNFYLDYAQLSPGKVSGQVVRLPTAGLPVSASANAYLELSFAGMGSDSLYPSSSTGNIQYRLGKSDWSLFDQSNDYSYQAVAPLALNPKMSVYLNGVKVYGSEPGGLARQGVGEAGHDLQLIVLGNPVVGEMAEIEVVGVEGQPLELALTNPQGQLLHQRQVESASARERVLIPVSSGPGLRLLEVRTPSQRQIVKFLKP